MAEGKEEEKGKEEKKPDDFLAAVQQVFGAAKLPPQQYSALGLAYIGDSVYDLIIRTIVVDAGNEKVNNLHRMTSEMVKASAQAQMAEAIADRLTKEEMAAYRHGRNAKSATTAKNASVNEYRMATGFEALLGFLYLEHRTDRILELVNYGLKKTGQHPVR